MTSPDFNIEWVWGIAILVLGIALCYGLMRARTRTRSEKQMSEAGAKRRYEEEDAARR